MYSSKSCVRQDEGETVQECGEEAKAVQGYCEVIRCQVPVLTKAELHGLGGGLLLGVGGFGSVRLVGQENGAPAVVKELLQTDQLLPVLKEATFLLQLGGAGGAPRLLGVCQAPPALVQEFVGQTYDTYLEVCSVKGFLESLQAVCQCLEEVHAKGIVHNDLKWNNITFSGSVNAPRFHIIDFGWASSSGSVVVEREEGQSDEDSFIEEDEGSHSRQAPWMAPEVFGGGRVFPSGDVYSLGFLMGCLMDRCPHDFLTGPLRSLSRSCTARDASRRPSLARVAHCLAILASILTPHQLDHYFEEAEEEEEKKEEDQADGEGEEAEAVQVEEEEKKEQDEDGDNVKGEEKKKEEVGEDDDAYSDDEEDEVDDKASEEDEGEKDDEVDDMMTKDKMKVEKCDELESESEEEEDERGNEGEYIELQEENKEEGNRNDEIILTKEKQKKKEDSEEDDMESEEEERDEGDVEEEDEGDEIEEKHEDDRQDKHIDDGEEKHKEGDTEEKHEGNDRDEKDSDDIDEKEKGDDIEEEDRDDTEEEGGEGNENYDIESRIRRRAKRKRGR
ncbi:hypothetical protein O3P69_008301 [Scylla paramamosain]|uniref:Protein kinase domain-containing protein n=2 Tax=Scylla paramamosain TaxID=85552 RepID=A0AAW0SKP6_SCYPA